MIESYAIRRSSVRTARPKVPPETLLLKALKNILIERRSCYDCPVAIKVEDIQQRGYTEYEDHCLHRRENGEPHTQGLSRHPDDIIRATACTRETEQRVPLLRKLRMRTMVLAMRFLRDKSFGKFCCGAACRIVYSGGEGSLIIF